MISHHKKINFAFIILFLSHLLCFFQPKGACLFVNNLAFKGLNVENDDKNGFHDQERSWKEKLEKKKKELILSYNIYNQLSMAYTKMCI